LKSSRPVIPPPRRHRHHYYGVFAPHARWRTRVTACAGQPVLALPLSIVASAAPMHAVRPRRRAALHWAHLLARIFESRPRTCPRCNGAMRLIALLTEPTSIRAILAHLGEATTPPPLAPRARAPPELDAGFAFDQSPPWDPTTPPTDPGLSFDQTLA
jgi:hypothetical protein